MTISGSWITPPGLRWCPDNHQVIIACAHLPGETIVLTRLEAALWNWLSLSYAYPDLLAFTQAYLDLPAGEAGARLEAILQGWIAVGLLIPGSDSAPVEDAG